jgi:hypothetical protein
MTASELSVVSLLAKIVILRFPKYPVHRGFSLASSASLEYWTAFAGDDS